MELSFIDSCRIPSPYCVISMCSKGGFFQAKIGPVDGKSLPCLSGRIQAEPEKKKKKVKSETKILIKKKDKKKTTTDGIPFLKGSSHSEGQNFTKNFIKKNDLPITHVDQKLVVLNTTVLARATGRRNKEYCIFISTEAHWVLTKTRTDMTVFIKNPVTTRMNSR